MKIFKMILFCMAFIAISCTAFDVPVSTRVITGTSNYSPGDSDCDGVLDVNDQCPGGDDSVDKNNDGFPDCAYPPGYVNVDSTWKCSTPSLQKVKVCTKTPSGGCITVCTYYSAVQMHISRGGFLGPCKSCQ